MTCREKLKMEYPDKVSDNFVGGCSRCPDHYGYLDRPDFCIYGCRDCYACWNREIPGSENIAECENTEFTTMIKEIRDILDDVESAGKNVKFRIYDELRKENEGLKKTD